MNLSPWGIGQPVRRREDLRFLKGEARFTDDVKIPDQLFGFVVRSPHAHAFIQKINFTLATKIPGVHLVLTAADYEADGFGPIPHSPNPAHINRPKQPAFDNKNGSPVFQSEHWPLAKTKVRYLGEPVAFVVANSLETAEEAGALIDITYQPIDAVTNVRCAISENAPSLWDGTPGNICFDSELGDQKAVEAAFAEAVYVVSLSLKNNRISAVPLEPRGGIGVYDKDKEHYTLMTGSQGAHRLKDPLVKLLGCPANSVRVICGDVGGGFGMRNWLFPELVLVIWAAKRCGQPVKWISSRSESFVSDMQARDLATFAKLALDGSGKFLAVSFDHLSNIGAHTISFVPLANGVRLVTSIYDIPHAFVRARGVVTNTLPTGPYRGAGRPEAMFNIERLIDVAAAETGIGRLAIRRRNLIPIGKSTYRNAVGLTYECGAFLENMENVVELSHWDAFEKRRLESASRGMLRGIGLANYIETPVGFPREVCNITINQNGLVIVVVGTQSHGQGHETSFSQVISDQLGVGFDSIKLVSGDTDLISDGGGSHSDRSMRIAGTLMVNGCETLIKKGQTFAAEMLEAHVEDVEFLNGQYRVTGTDHTVGLIEIAQRAAIKGSPLEANEKFNGRIPAYPNGSAVAEIEVDPETGNIEVCRWTSVDDVGRVINPMIVEGQTHGGIAQGIGQGLYEDIGYEEKSGQLRGGTLLDYCIPRADHFPFFQTETANNAPTAGNPLGVKGGGEGGTIPALGALFNAILDALKPMGVSEVTMPATPYCVWQAIQNAKQKTVQLFQS
ncbi:MAG: xanthine dehydrogenase family protein molybdopterin-binding subunit [Pseudomonadota bacterium]|nr:xanthine dehydrogenase family protein molybdopterin-binding subunit [Pseudomonadota bacterium]